ncbi:MAG: HEAT repeat domain-containing protein [Acidobacteria bacterium]|nr:HEAT repeat domain-containing protein [Acidobacteriota bacterium]
MRAWEAALPVEAIEQLVSGFEDNPIATRRSLVEAWDTDESRFFQSAIRLLNQPEDTPGRRFLADFLLHHRQLAERLSDTELLTRDEAVNLARFARRVDPSLEMRLAMKVTEVEKQDGSVGRILEILSEISQPSSLLPLLAAILHHSDPRVRSKAALMMGKGNRNGFWVKQQLSDPDARVRANAVESLWGTDSKVARQVYSSAMQDEHPRVAVNGALGLYLSGSPLSVEGMVELAGREDAGFRNSVSWGMGRTQDPRFLPVLERLERDPDPRVRSNAQRAMEQIRLYRQLLETKSPLVVSLLDATMADGGERQLRVSVALKGQEEPPALPATSFVIEENGAFLCRYEVQPNPKAAGGSAGLALPCASDLNAETAQSIEQAWSDACGLKFAGASWAVSCYSNTRAQGESLTPAYTGSPAALLAAREAAVHSARAGFLTALRELLTAAPKGARALIVVGSPQPETSAVVDNRSANLESFLKEAQSAGAPIHAIATADCPPMLGLALREASSATAGSFRQAEDAESLGRDLRSVLLASHPAYILRYQAPPEAAGGRVRLLVHCPYGAGECSAELSQDSR